MQEQVRFVTVTSDEHGQRLDNFLASRLKGVPKSAIYRLVRKGEVRVNKGRSKPDRRLADGDVVRLPPVRTASSTEPPKPSARLTTTLEHAILFDADGLVVVNKPSGLAVHGGSGVNLGLVEALRQLPEYKGFLELIHRLDKDTSGCVMLARKRAVLQEVQDKLRARDGVQKTYIALVQGAWPNHLSEVNVPLLRMVMPNNERIVKVHKEGKPSITQFRVLARCEHLTLVEAHPVTGRTHQIRVHAKHVGCPLVGDDKYGDTPLNSKLSAMGSARLFLHAYQLKLTLKDQHLAFTAPLPSELQRTLKLLGVESGQLF